MLGLFQAVILNDQGVIAMDEGSQGMLTDKDLSIVRAVGAVSLIHRDT